jgi:hypothetical protein
MGMAEKDTFEKQTKRIRQKVIVIFDTDKAPHRIRFHIEDGTGTILTSAYPEYYVSEIADWTDLKLQQMIESLTAGRP